MKNLLVARYVENITHAGIYLSHSRPLTHPPVTDQLRDTLLRHFKMHDLRRGCKTQSLIIHRNSTDHSKQHSSDSASRKGEPCGQQPVIEQTGPDAATEYSGLEESNMRKEATSTFESSTHEQYEMFHPEASSLRPISIPTDMGSPISVSSNSIANPSDFTAGYPALGVLDNSNLDDSATNWFLDESFNNIFDDWSMDAIWTDTKNVHDLALAPPTSASARDITKPSATLDLRQIWHVQVGYNIADLDSYCQESGRHLPTTSTADIDELFRTNIAKEFRLLPSTEPLPSIDFLVFFHPLPCFIS